MNKKFINIDKNNKIPVYVFGKNPKILLMAGVHGNEKTGVVILKNIIKQLRHNNASYPVAIIPCVNSLAYQTNSRINPKDNVDLNRIFPVIKLKSYSYKIAKAIQDFARKFSLIIDIHVFTGQHTLLCGIDLNIKKNKKINRIMSQLGMEAICRIDHLSEPKKNGSLCDYLQRKNILAFGIELPPLEVLTKTDINKIMDNLLVLINGTYEKIKIKKLKSYTRLQSFSEHNGVFLPKKFPGDKIKKGDLVGSIKRQDRKIFSVKSLVNGILISISYKRFLKKGDKMFVVGEKVKS